MVERKDFNKALASYLSGWIADIAIPAARIADKLYEDESFKYILMTWYDEDKHRNEMRENTLMFVINDDDDIEFLNTSYTDEFRSNRIFHYSSVMHDILKNVYNVGN